MSITLNLINTKQKMSYIRKYWLRKTFSETGIKDLYNTDLQKIFVIQTRWNLFSNYNQVYNFIANSIDSHSEYFRVLYVQSGITNWYIEVE